MLWPARSAREKRPSAAGNCSSNVFRRFFFMRFTARSGPAPRTAGSGP